MTQTPKVNLVIQTAFLGDLLLSVPLLKNIRTLWPNEKIVLVCRSGVGGLLHRLGLVDAVHEIVKGDSESYRLLKQALTKYEIHNLFCPHESFRSAVLVHGITAKNKIGFKSWWNFLFFNQRITKPAALPDALRQLSLLQNFSPELRDEFSKLDAKIFTQKNPVGKLSSVPSWADSSVRNVFLNLPAPENLKSVIGQKPLALLFPGSVWATKRWTPEGFLAVGQWLENNGFQVVWMGSTIEKPLCEELNKNLKNTLVLAGTTSIFESCWLMSRAKLVIGNDSSSSHMASLTETPVIAVFGPTTVDFGYRPWHNNAYISEIELFCRPCGPHGHHQCPRGTHDCMKQLKAQQVIAQIKTILPNIP